MTDTRGAYIDKDGHLKLGYSIADFLHRYPASGLLRHELLHCVLGPSKPRYNLKDRRVARRLKRIDGRREKRIAKMYKI